MTIKLVMAVSGLYSLWVINWQIIQILEGLDSDFKGRFQYFMKFCQDCPNNYKFRGVL